MTSSILGRLRSRLPRRSLAFARVRSLLSGHPLPPGAIAHLDRRERSNRRILLDEASAIGPVFKASAWGELWICLVGVSRGRRFLKEHSSKLELMTMRLEPLFPKGFLRQMEGEDHRHYRRTLVRAIRSDDLTASLPELEKMARDRLAAYASRPGLPPPTAEDYIATLNDIASGMLIRVFFGVSPGGESFARLLEGYRKLGPGGVVWHIGEPQTRAYVEIRDHLMEHHVRHPERLPAGARQSILGRMVDEGSVDETILGNLIYMVETGRYDTYSLFRWLTKYAADHPALAERIAREGSGKSAPGRSLSEAFVLETLRTDKSERLMRRALSDLVFEGFLIPKHSIVRICVWESHKSAEAFENPFQFNPDHFLAANPGPDQFAPFGMDHHQCPLGDLAIQSSVTFLRALVRDYTVVPTADGLPVRGPFHWEPATEFAVQLKPRT